MAVGLSDEQLEADRHLIFRLSVNVKCVFFFTGSVILSFLVLELKGTGDIFFILLNERASKTVQ